MDDQWIITNPAELIILLANGFDAQLITEITTRGRSAGHRVTLVGLTIGPLRSDLGIRLNPDRTLDQVSPTQEPMVVLIPGGKACASALLRDPRVHQLCEVVQTKGGKLLGAPSILIFLQEAGIPAVDMFEFLEQLDWTLEGLNVLM